MEDLATPLLTNQMCFLKSDLNMLGNKFWINDIFNGEAYEKVYKSTKTIGWHFLATN